MNPNKTHISTRLDNLPNEILENIFDYLNYKDLTSLSQVNKRLNSITDDNFIWKKKLLEDLNKWKEIDSKTYPYELFNLNADYLNESNSISIKNIYFRCCPELNNKNKKELNDKNNSIDESKTQNISYSNNFTLSSFAMPAMMLGQLRNFFQNNISRLLTDQTTLDKDRISKLVMFGPGLETATSCLVTNILWKSEFKTIGMVPGRDGLGSGIKLKLFEHEPFNLTTLYTNFVTIRNSKNNYNLNDNKLLVSNKKDDENDEVLYELQPYVKKACSDASGFIYVIDNNQLAQLKNENENSKECLENYKLELKALMNATDKKIPLLILSCCISDYKSKNSSYLSCASIVEKLEFYKMDRIWHLRNCNIFEPKIKDITLGFDWILDQLETNST